MNFYLNFSIMDIMNLCLNVCNEYHESLSQCLYIGYHEFLSQCLYNGYHEFLSQCLYNEYHEFLSQCLYNGYHELQLTLEIIILEIINLQLY